MEKEKLVEIKKGQTGHGLLIENEGFMSITEETKNKINESIDDNGDFYCPNPFIVNAVFQKFGIKNANGRIYPENILKREVEKYMKRIHDHNAIGECYTDSASILCKDGWKSIVDVKEGDEVYTLNTDTNEVEIQKVTYKTEQRINRHLIRLKSDDIDEMVTTNHGFPLYENDKFLGFFTAEQLTSMHVKEQYIPGTCNDIKNNDIYLKDVKFSRKSFKGMVYCVEVPNHTWYVKDNGHSHWTKNCNHPSESTIDLSRVAINIIELHWEQHTLVGKMEILVTPGFRKFGIVSTCADEVANLLIHDIKIGVSSRGLGTVSQQGGVLVVGNDFELVCWDVVSEPSTPGSYIDVNKENLNQYVEGEERIGTQLTEDKFSKFDSWLND